MHPGSVAQWGLFIPLSCVWNVDDDGTMCGWHYTQFWEEPYQKVSCLSTHYWHITACTTQQEASDIPCHMILLYFLSALEATWEAWLSEAQENQVKSILHNFALTILTSYKTNVKVFFIVINSHLNMIPLTSFIPYGRWVGFKLANTYIYLWLI